MDFSFDIKKELDDLNNLVEKDFDCLDQNHINYCYGNKIRYQDEGTPLFYSDFRIGDIINYKNKFYRIHSCFPSYGDNIPEWYFKLYDFDCVNYKTIIPNQIQPRTYQSVLKNNNVIVINKANYSIIP